jgi:hypothetical protein
VASSLIGKTFGSDPKDLGSWPDSPARCLTIRGSFNGRTRAFGTLYERSIRSPRAKAGVIQRLECLVANENVMGSSPITRSKFGCRASVVIALV